MSDNQTNLEPFQVSEDGADLIDTRNGKPYIGFNGYHKAILLTFAEAMNYAFKQGHEQCQDEMEDHLQELKSRIAF